MKHYPHHIGDFDRATRHLTRLERSVYRDLIDLYYDTEQRLTLDMAALCRRIIARSNEEATAVEQVLNEFFTETPTGWYHERCEAEIEAYRANNSQRALAGKASAEAKRLKKQQAINGGSTVVDAPLNSVATNGNGAPTNQSTNQPINQEPKEDMAKTGDADLSPILGLEDEPDVPTQPSVDTCPHQAIVALFNELLPSACQIREWNATRQQLLRSRWREDKRRQNIEWWRRFFTYVGESDFLMGRASTPGRKPFLLDINWLLNHTNFTKVREGKYHEAEVAA